MLSHEQGYHNIDPIPSSTCQTPTSTIVLLARNDMQTGETASTPLPPQTTHYWTSDRTRRLEYAAIDSAPRGLRGWLRRRLGFRPRHISFDDDSGSVRRYRLHLSDDDDDDDDDEGGGGGGEGLSSPSSSSSSSSSSSVEKRRPSWQFWRHLRKTKTV
ncbi:hypothetical protein L249_2528 [Ophiocordyceps polyrhachis-furcata BCC 54312]|uniref:Uncharacterized protein n=1 Tax=Ophiocordyceps polyrhachis-furcata BCC 54312 TaxID=1330021 RepID=A0A367LNH0_9HYPO|nr:hypothetical protein L249_2528 [Ophiocordyceps polyrhachis-furcata BCC 54312]